MNETQGKFIAIEGPDGGGKTSQSKKLAEYLKAAWWRFPNRDTPMGKLIDKHLKRQWAASYSEDPGGHDPSEEHLDALVFQALQLGNRMELHEELNATLVHQHVVCDRYWPSGYAYGGADGLDKKYMVELHAGLRQPDLFILFDIGLDEIRQRMEQRGARDRYEGNEKFLQKVIDNYNELWSAHSHDRTWVRIDARGSVEETWERLVAAVRHLAPTKIG